MTLFMSHVDRNGPPCERYPGLGPCWLWTASSKRNPKGRRTPQFTTGGRAAPRNYVAVRWLYEQTVQEVPPGLFLDHFACDRGEECVNPSHVRPASVRENNLRSDTCPAAINRAKTHCLRRHPLNGSNVRVSPAGKRFCRTCDRDRARAKRQAVRERTPSGVTR